MTLTLETCDFPLHGDKFLLSARRLWEHTQLGQVQVFNAVISSHQSLNDTYAFIDLVATGNGQQTLCGFTLAELIDKKAPLHHNEAAQQAAEALADTVGHSAFMVSVKKHIQQFSLQQAVRNPNKPFLPSASPNDLFSIPNLYSSLERKLRRLGKTKATDEEWLNTIQKFTQKGIRVDEITCSELNAETLRYKLSEKLTSDKHTAIDLADICDFNDLRLSIIAVHKNAHQLLKFVTPPDKKLPRTKKQAKAQTDQARQIAHFDPVLGYRLEKVIHQTL
jgi:hypothetical protein